MAGGANHSPPLASTGSLPKFSTNGAIRNHSIDTPEYDAVQSWLLRSATLVHDLPCTNPGTELNEHATWMSSRLPAGFDSILECRDEHAVIIGISTRWNNHTSKKGAPSPTSIGRWAVQAVKHIKVTRGLARFKLS
ncbi:uncharacterized protein BO96DRAFT_330836 [Aspergillus niger CBS 101883]|uniref:Uncharacterized protein n=2 Tax=Aspergillus niger TaxID=5061 RepID=A2QIM2_ASPNC|nr:uncharacterized protein BO96DRAFT_330836 [Aspergillus niger CBS 101883]XP_059600516.1 hypothetical protein An04g04020 [Aspergillus niger]PYH59466.1 hypothetical protein BO96DRAFT_330836 [Aspergillus niger CBS 101883]CAK38666.1 hypothetical protein An04g04020 [Aspergillus niger]